MRYKSFTIQNYRAIEDPITLYLFDNTLLPLVGINECGKTTILQGIFCFDYINDSEYKGIHLENTLNLYKTFDKDPLISADIEISYKKFSNYFTLFIEKPENQNVNIKALSDYIPQNKYNGILKIKRNLKIKKYSINELDILDPELQDKFSRILIEYMPYILYNDDFQDRPLESINIPNVKPEKLSGWLSIYERLFNVTDSEYSLFKIVNEQDTRRKEAIISDVQEVLNKTLSKAWKTFVLDRQKSISVRLNILQNEGNPNSKQRLMIRIIEKIGNKERFFKIIDRSKGFLWFFNFVMKLEFNPKICGMRSDTVHLLDEPGSYLHSMAQEKLCSKLKDISEKHGHVIFCTHSHHLLNPKYIPINKILIVNKTPRKKITLTPLPKVDTKTEKTHAIQPIFEALHIPAYDFYNVNDPVIAVEGIYDKYVIELFIQLNMSFNILAGTSADSIIKNIQFLNAFRKNYIAIWDNDKEGRFNYKRAVNLFGPKESDRFDLLPSKNDKDRKMEDMIKKSDLGLIKNELNLSKDASYESAILELYYSKPVKKEKIIKSISNKTKENFDILKKIIEKRFTNANNLEEERI